MMDFSGQSVIVLGLGSSGRSAARFLATRGARVVAADERPRDTIQELDGLPSEIELRTGSAFPELAGYDLVVPSPGIPASRWQGRAERVWGDIELCHRALSIPIVAVTGTNGKSTVVRMIEAMARAAGLRAGAAGNLGLPALELVGQPLDLAILEVSSFQLESVDAFRPRVALLLNLTPDHLDRHGDFDAYRAAKARIFARQGEGDVAIVNGDDPNCAAIAVPGGVERLTFRRRAPVAAGAWLDSNQVVIHRGTQTLRVPLAPPADHTRADRAASHAAASMPVAAAPVAEQDNVLAALLALAPLDVDLRAATHALVHFEGLPHRCQLVARVAGVDYYDDSKATNVGAAARSLAGLPGPIVWIAGGRHKGGDLAPLATSARGRVRCALLIGEATPAFHRVLDDHVPCEDVPDLASAVERAAAVAEPGDRVLLAPACASFDQFRDFEDRGRQFQAAVQALATSGPAADRSTPSHARIAAMERSDAKECA